MLYTDYKTAAKRHIDTCLRLKKYLENPDNITSLAARVSEEQNIIANIYYLSGYIVECSVYYRFFDDNQSSTANGLVDNYNHQTICFKRGTPYRLSGHFQFPLDTAGTPKDAYRTSEKVLEAIHNQLSSSILQGTILESFLPNIVNRNPYQERWEPAIRYSIAFPINKQDVFNYLSEAAKIYNKLTQ